MKRDSQAKRGNHRYRIVFLLFSGSLALDMVYPVLTVYLSK
ncbi:hypothetical protein STRDD13_00786 [Streptococcus sp. DD13]|nr:hypothetical protein STRDD13_00786 [Streptococcus sp. DD13]